MSPKEFRDVIYKYLKSSADVLISDISKGSCDFCLVINDNENCDNGGRIKMILRVVNNILKYPGDLKVFLNEMILSKFLKTGLVRYYTIILIESKKLQTTDEKLLLQCSFSLMKLLTKEFPDNCVRVLQGPFNMISTLMTNKKVVKNVNETILRDYDEMKRFFETNKEQLKSLIQKRSTPKVSEPPPDDFRGLSVFPSHNDLFPTTHVYLRASLLDTGYKSVVDYLDTQFRLMKEDYVRSMRNGFKSFLGINADSCRKNNDLFFYERVTITDLFCFNSDLAYEITLDMSRLKMPNLESSKRLVHGSLLCFSSDNFNSILIATVCEGNPETIKQGKVLVKFEDTHINVEGSITSLLINSTFTVAEARVFFQPYHHVFKGFQLMSENDLPFHEIIVSCHTKQNKPFYARILGSVEFDFSILYKPASEKQPAVDLFNLNDWPSHQLLGYDIFQYKALQNSMTCELSVIQGPPGTGKTFVGLGIVKLLVENW